MKKNKIMSFAATWRDSDYHIKQSESEEDKFQIYHLNVKSKKIIQMNLCTKQKETHRHRKQSYDYQRENVEGRDKLRG